MLKKLVLFVILVVIVGAAAAYFARNYLVERAVESGSSYALGVETDLGSAGLALQAGSLELNNFEIDNPEGFEADNFLVIEHGMLDVNAGSVLDDEVVVDSLILEGIALSLEQIDKSGNYAVLLDHAKQIDMESSSSGEQKFKIKKLAIRDIAVDAKLTLLGSKQYDKTFEVEEITLNDVGGENGAYIGEITARVVKAIVSKATTTGSGFLPAGFGDLKEGVTDSLKQIEEDIKDKLKDAGTSILGGKK